MALLIILFHWLLKEHHRIMMGKEAGNGRDLSKGWRKAKVLPWPFTLPEHQQHR